MLRADSCCCYERHRPKDTPLYEIIARFLPPVSCSTLEADGGPLPAFVKQEFDD
jgi:hypothetical protein